jgi:hypothetical protein
MENNQLADAISSLNLGLFGYKSSHAKYNAQENLRGKTHFVDDDTMRFFGSRISRASHTASGLLFYVIESSYLDMNKTKRGFRYAVFDLFGNEVARQSLDEALSSSEKAHKAMYKRIDSLDVAEHYRQALQSVIRNSTRKAENTKEVLAKIGGQA